VRSLLVEVMRDYFDVDPRRSDSISGIPGLDLERASMGGSLPVRPSSPTAGWSLLKSPRRLTRTYEFRDSRMASDFLIEVMSHESRTGHHAKITCEFPLITIEVRTHDLDDVTELDQEYARSCDHIYADVGLYRSDLSGDFENGW